MTVTRAEFDAIEMLPDLKAQFSLTIIEDGQNDIKDTDDEGSSDDGQEQ